MKYTYPDFLLLFDGVLAIFAAVYSLAYLIHWRNGKSVTSFFSFFLFGYLGVVHLLAFINILDRLTYGAIYVRPVLPLVYGMIIAHVYIDWQKNKVSRLDFERRLFDKLKKKKGKNV